MKTKVAFLALAGVLALAPAPSRAAGGAEVYRRKCAGCHGADGGGGSRKLTPLTAPEVEAKSDQELFDAVAKGTPDRKMPAFRGRLADDEIRAAVGYVRGLRK